MTAILASGTAVGFYFLDQVTNSGLDLLYNYPYELAAGSIFFGRFMLFFSHSYIHNLDIKNNRSMFL